ncbi:MAG: hypothetical protein VR73_03870 [Gammaproteobacteria bacterium BRH_c0]|nr:MAG: hypothetical protein VR73_03870 [Gammaproteobacteria bacterium BRH_c0]
MFQLDPQLERDCVVIGRFPLCLLLLSRDANYPWFILVPQRAGVTELYHLSSEDRAVFMAESSTLSELLMDVFAGDKFNVAALGNVVSQLHIHHIVRYRSDPAWPRPVWGAVPPLAYTPENLQQRVKDLVPLLSGLECEVLFAGDN